MNNQTRSTERSLIWWDRLLSLSLGWTYCQQGQSSGLQLWKCDSHSAIRLILNSVLTEKCPNNQIVYFNYIKFPGSQNIIVASWRQLEIHFRQPWSWYKDPPAGFNGSDTGNFADYCCHHVGRQKLGLLRPMKLPLGGFFRDLLAVADVGGGVKNWDFNVMQRREERRDLPDNMFCYQRAWLGLAVSGDTWRLTNLLHINVKLYVLKTINFVVPPSCNSTFYNLSWDCLQPEWHLKFSSWLHWSPLCWLRLEYQAVSVSHVKSSFL